MEEPSFASVPLLILDNASIGKCDQAGCAFHNHRIMGGEDEGHLLNPVELPHHRHDHAVTAADLFRREWVLGKCPEKLLRSDELLLSAQHVSASERQITSSGPPVR